MTTVYFVYRSLKSRKGGPSWHPFLYGYTDNKKVIKDFKKERDMEQFYIMEKSLTTDEIFEIDSHNSYQRIKFRKYTTYIKDETGYIKDYVEISSTEFEEEKTYIWSDLVLGEAGKFTKYPEFIFNKDIVKALSILEYPVIREYKKSGMEHEIMYPPVVTGNKISNISTDMFYVFMYLFGNTMRKDK